MREGLAVLLARAMHAERDERWDESLRLCQEALEAVPNDPGALNLLGRLCARGGDVVHAMALQQYALSLDPNHARAARDLAAIVSAPRSPGESEARLTAAISIAPDVTCHHRHPVSLVPFARMEHVEHLVRETLRTDPLSPEAHAVLGNIFARRGHRVAGIVEYSLAVRLRPNFADAHLALAGLFEALHDDARAQAHRTKALDIKRIYPASPASAGSRLRVLVLAAPGGATRNTPLEFFINPYRTALHVYYLVEGMQAPEIMPDYDVVFNGIEEAESSAGAVQMAAAFAASQCKPVINIPGREAALRRSELWRTLRGVDDCVVPPTSRVPRDRIAAVPESTGAIDGIPFPLLIRPIDTHAGRGLERLASASELHDYLAREPGAFFNLSPFVEYRSADGWYRKYRIVVIDGKPFAYHLAIGEHWMLHYAAAAIEKHEWMLTEEERFLADPRSVFPNWEQPFDHLAQRFGLDYFGVDCTVLPDGTTLIFECGTAMLVHCRDAPAYFHYRYRYVPRIFDAFDDLLVRRTRGITYEAIRDSKK